MGNMFKGMKKKIKLGVKGETKPKAKLPVAKPKGVGMEPAMKVFKEME